MRSIAMATYQGMPYIRAQLDSILAQMSPSDELVVSDNGSTDGTLAYLKDASKKDRRIRLFNFPEPKGVVPNFQNALMHCQGEIIFLSDQDDIWKISKMEDVTKKFAETPSLMAVQADAETIDEAGISIASSFFEKRTCGSGIWKNFRKNTWQGCSMAFRKSLLEIVLPFPAKIPMHDMWIGIMAELSGDVLFLPTVLTSYRRHAKNASGDTPAGWRKIIVWRVRLAMKILARMPGIRRFKRKASTK